MPEIWERELVQGDGLKHRVSNAVTLTEAYVTGEPVVALCGKVMVPAGRGTDLPDCRRCKDLGERLAEI